MDILKIANNFDVIIWDFDGTLVELEVNWDNLKKELLNVATRAGYTEKDNTLNRILYFLIDKGFKDKAFTLLRRYENNALYKVNQKIIKVIKKTPDKKHIIISDNLKKTIIKILNQLNITSFFDLIIAKEDVTNFKPHPEGLRKILQVYSNHKILYIGDSWKDKEIAHECKVKFLEVERME
ncbi:MAG: HAD family hydrolase [Candidatus Desulfofervidus auxilii]|nr:HAD family hydrolase [Candidatus Desulfofervidus auxilii]